MLATSLSHKHFIGLFDVILQIKETVATVYIIMITKLLAELHKTNFVVCLVYSDNRSTITFLIFIEKQMIYHSTS